MKLSNEWCSLGITGIFVIKLAKKESPFRLPPESCEYQPRMCVYVYDDSIDFVLHHTSFPSYNDVMYERYNVACNWIKANMPEYNEYTKAVSSVDHGKCCVQ